MIIHDKMLHNCLLNSDVSHKLMPKVVMESLELSITRPFHDQYACDSRVVKCIGITKYLVVNLPQLPMKSILMDVVVDDIPISYIILLSRYFTMRMGQAL